MKETVMQLYDILMNFDDIHGDSYQYSIKFRDGSILISVADEKYDYKFSWSLSIKEVKTSKIDLIKNVMESLTEEINKRRAGLKEENYD